MITPIFAQRGINNGVPNAFKPVKERKRCITTKELYKNHPEDLERILKAKENVYDITRNQYMTSNRELGGETKKIPVVVHVIHNDGPEKISEAQINSQITVLNNDFNRNNADASNTPSAFSGVAADAGIEYFLAKIDPNGECTNGINYVKNSVYTELSTNGNEEDNMKSETQWDPAKYLNIWVVKTIDGGGILGYAYFPESPAGIEGLVIIHDAFGTTGSVASPYNGGRTAVHEIGHYLGLTHIWGEDYQCNGDDDGVDDTPFQKSDNGGCPSHPSTSCSNSGDMFMNYMDYVNDACMNMFSAGQSTIMNYHLDNSVRRKTLHTESNLQATGYYGCGSATLAADFTSSVTTADIGENITFTDQSNGAPTSWSWSVSPDGHHTYTTGSSSSETPIMSFDSAGTYTVTMTVSDGSTSDNTSNSIIIEDTTGNGNGKTQNENEYSEITLETSSSSNCGFYHYPPTDDFTYKPTDAEGYVGGHNGWLDIAKADFIDNSSSVDYIFGAAVDFSLIKSNTPSTSTFNLSVWTTNGAIPGTKIATKSFTYQSVIDANNKPYFTFDEPIEVNGVDFFIGIEFTYIEGDTLVIRTNSLDDGNTAYELWEDDTWNSFVDSWNIHSQLWIFPRVGNLVDAEVMTDTEIICTGNTVEFSTTNTSNITNYSWTIDGSKVPGNSSTLSLSFSETGTYTYSLSAQGACNTITSSGSITVNECTDIVELDQSALNIYPNPANDILFIDADHIESITIYNVLGKIVYYSNESKVRVNTLENGIYYISVKTNESIHQQSIQIMH